MLTQQEETVFLTAAEDIFTSYVTEHPEILEGCPETVINGETRAIQKESGQDKPDVEVKVQEEVDDSKPDIIRLGTASTGWIDLPEDAFKRYELIKRASAALAETLNQIREKSEHFRQKKLKTVRTRAFFEYPPDPQDWPPFSKEPCPPGSSVKLSVRHTLRVR